MTAETDGENVREETVVRKACKGKPGSHGSKVILLSHAQGWSHHITSLFLHASTVQRLAHQMPDALKYKVGPHPGCSFSA